MKSFIRFSSKSLTFFSITLLLVVLSCSKSDDAKPATPADNGATIDGKVFAPTTTTATSTGTGLSISLKDSGKEIAMSTNDKVAGTYAITNSVPSGRAQATFSAIVSYYDGTDLYYGFSGTIVITIDTSGKASGTFTITFKTASGKSIELKDGKFTGLAVGTGPAGKCLISKITEGSSLYYFDYDGDGRLIRTFTTYSTSSEQVNYFYTGGVMTNLIRIKTDANNKTTTELETWAYTAGKVTLVTRTSNLGTSTFKAIDNYNLEYNTAGLISKATWNYSDGKAVSTLEYDGNSNVTKSTGVYTGSFNSTDVSVYSNYDSKPNPILLIAQTMGASNQAFLITGTETFGYELSKNNVGKNTFTSSTNTTVYLDTYTYEYNAKGYVTKVTETSSCNGCSAAVTKLDYVGCN